MVISAGIALASQAMAASITGYDVTNALESGYGSWSYNYTGTSSYAGTSVFGSNLFDLSGGSGTLNDGIIPTSAQNNQFFAIADNSTIRLHLGSLTTISSIVLYGGNFPNYIPGTLTGWSVTINGHTVNFNSTSTGTACPSGPCDDSVTLAGSGLELLATTTITLSNFQGGWQSAVYNIGEIAVSGATANVPEPAALALLGLGMASMCVTRRRKS